MRIGPGQHVLDVAAGAGEQSRAAAGRVGPAGSVLATDISPALLALAAADAAAADSSRAGGWPPSCIPRRRAMPSSPSPWASSRRRAQLPPPLPGQPGPFSLGAPGALRAAFEQAGLRDIEVQAVDSPVRLPSAAECVRFERESFGALHQMMATLSEAERADTWREIEAELRQFEAGGAFVGPCEMLVGGGVK